MSASPENFLVLVLNLKIFFSHFFPDIDPSIKPVSLEHYISGRLQTVLT